MATAKKRQSSSKTSIASRTDLPRLQTRPLPEQDNFNERSSRTSTQGLSTAWIIVFAFVLLAAISVLVWAILSGRSDGKIHGENIEKIKESSASEEN